MGAARAQASLSSEPQRACPWLRFDKLLREVLGTVLPKWNGLGTRVTSKPFKGAMKGLTESTLVKSDWVITMTRRFSCHAANLL